MLYKYYKGLRFPYSLLRPSKLSPFQPPLPTYSLASACGVGSRAWHWQIRAVAGACALILFGLGSQFGFRVKGFRWGLGLRDPNLGLGLRDSDGV